MQRNKLKFTKKLKNINNFSKKYNNSSNDQQNSTLHLPLLLVLYQMWIITIKDKLINLDYTKASEDIVMIMVKFISESSKKGKDMASDVTLSKMEIDTRANIKKMLLMGQEFNYFLQGQAWLLFIKKMHQMELEFIILEMVKNYQDNLNKILLKEKV